ncbi:DUF2608 domain-containing protein [Chlamydia caviae]|uniref:Outer membrane protein n=1 Tax=Chlamydia caviae (strain ATCC VR-813 / DSM 19441 / 03DC25 / GPIC) TaxID=227941 RepID=Q823V5_CHLCV|nr:DUF2608 domain-containing protein [Chlamydia caviae]AAP05049.1 conserved hypothetical protein [Chlamydia caviae GPIC]
MKVLFFILAIFSVFSLEASIIQVSNAQAVNKYAKQETLVLLALEETMIFPKQMVGNSSWFHQRLESVKNEESIADPFEKAFAEKIAVSFAVDYELIHSDIPKVIKALSLSQAWVLGVSQLPIPMAKHFLQTAQDLGVGFSSCLPIREDGWMQHPKTLAKPQHAIFIEDQVLFTGRLVNEIPLEEVLAVLFATIETLPKQVVYLDANKDNLIAAEAACKRANIFFIGMHYSPAEQRLQGYKSDIAEMQWLQLCTHLSDEYFQSLLTYVIGPEG